MNIKTLKKWWSFLRFQNILIIVLTQYLIRIFIIHENYESVSLTAIDFFILVITTAIIAIGGNIINDIYDYPIDKINKPEKIFINHLIAQKSAWIFYFSTNIVALLSSVYFYFFANWKTGVIYFIITPVLLWLYSYRLKKTVLIGNLLVAFICALVPIMVVHAEYNLEDKGYFIANYFISFYAFFAFTTTLYREIVKDIEDQEGDKKYDSFTLPIVFGQRIAKNVALSIGMILLIVMIRLITLWKVASIVQLTYLIILIVLPISYSVFQLFKATEKKDFNKVSHTIKLIMLFGLLFLIIL